MIRITKTYHERKKQILSIARTAFFTRGYQATSVNDLIERIGIAKGTFYHYFNSKQDLLVELTDLISDEYLAVISKDLHQSGYDALTRFRELATKSLEWKTRNRKILFELMRVIYNPENLFLQHTLVETSIKKSRPLLEAIIRQGIAEGTFQVQYPERVAELIMVVLARFGEKMGKSLLAFYDTEQPVSSEFVEWGRVEIRVHEFIIARILGVNPEEMRLFDMDRLKLFVEPEAD